MDVQVQKHRMLRWLGKLLVAMFVAASCPAQAEIEKVSPVTVPVYTNSTCTALTVGTLASCQASTPIDACNRFLMSNWGMPFGPPGYPAPVFVRLVQQDANTWQCNYNYYQAVGYKMDSGLSAITVAATCPQATPAYTFNPVSGMCERTSTCPVLPLPNPLFPASDKDTACSNSLEAGKGVDVNNKCGSLTNDMAAAAACIAKKIGALSSPHVDYTGPSATIRTTAYQNHLLEIWTKWQQLDAIMNSLSFTPEYSATMKQVCAQRKMEIDGEKNRHGIKHQPSSAGDAAPHVEHRAIDVPEVVAKALINQVTLYATRTTIVNGQKKTTRVVVSNVEDYIHSATINPPECDSNIRWGGLFKYYDPVHFQLP